MTQLFGVVLK